jgi:hypothetical protein
MRVFKKTQNQRFFDSEFFLIPGKSKNYPHTGIDSMPKGVGHAKVFHEE